MSGEARGGARDGSSLRRRLDAVGRALAAEATPESARAVLEERARALARPPVARDRGESLEVVVFRRGDERCAVATRDVLEVVRLGPVTPLPGAQAPVLGLSARRGGLLLVLDLGTAAPDAPAPGWALALGDPRAAVGVAADSIEQVMRLPLAGVLPPSDGVGGGQSWLRGVSTDAILVIDAPALIRTHS